MTRDQYENTFNNSQSNIVPPQPSYPTATSPG